VAGAVPVKERCAPSLMDRYDPSPHQDPSGTGDGHGTAPRALSRREWFFASYLWLVLKNVMGWGLILAAMVAGPLVPGPGGIPLFLIGFALISFPGKRRLTARVLRGRPVRWRARAMLWISVAVALALPALVMALAPAGIQPAWLGEQSARGPLAVLLLYLLGAALTWLLVWVSPRALNLVLRLVPRARRRVRPWLRHQGIRLLPPRRRRRHPHEGGSGPFRLKDEILKFYRKRRHDRH
jgi:hypothetical protein